MRFPIERDQETGVFLARVELDKNNWMVVILDTGASVTTFDTTEMLMAGHDLSDAVGTAEIETGNGAVLTQIFELREIAAFGGVRKKFPNPSL